MHILSLPPRPRIFSRTILIVLFLLPKKEGRENTIFFRLPAAPSNRPKIAASLFFLRADPDTGTGLSFLSFSK